jgi:hypothetical protein
MALRNLFLKYTDVAVATIATIATQPEREERITAKTAKTATANPPKMQSYPPEVCTKCSRLGFTTVADESAAWCFTLLEDGWLQTRIPGDAKGCIIH